MPMYIPSLSNGEFTKQPQLASDPSRKAISRSVSFLARSVGSAMMNGSFNFRLPPSLCGLPSYEQVSSMRFHPFQSAFDGVPRYWNLSTMHSEDQYLAAADNISWLCYDMDFDSWTIKVKQGEVQLPAEATIQHMDLRTLFPVCNFDHAVRKQAVLVEMSRYFRWLESQADGWNLNMRGVITFASRCAIYLEDALERECLDPFKLERERMRILKELM